MSTLVRFDRFAVDLASGQVRKNGVRVPLREQSFQVLAALLERPGQVVTREDLRQRLWPDVIVDFENDLNSAVARLRQVLGDSAERPRFVETLPRRGYRFLAPVSNDGAATMPEVPPRPRLLVLPFVNLTGDPAQEYLCDAMTEEVITEISAQAPDLGVIARTTAMRYKRTRKDVAQIGCELNVHYIVEGAFCRDGGRLGVTAQLVRTSDHTHVFAQRYDAELHDVLETRSQIATAIIARIPDHGQNGRSIAAPASEPHTRRKPTDNEDAYREYMQGRYLLERLDGATVREAKRHFENALALDRNFALAHDGLAELYGFAGYAGFLRPRDAFSVGISHALAAVEVDDSLAEAHALLAEYHKQLDYNWGAAERQMARALELDGKSPTVRLRHALAVLMPHNRIEEAIREIELALETDPLSPLAQAWLGVMLLLGRHSDRAMREARRLIENEPRSPYPFFVIGCGYRHMYTEALARGEHGQDLAEEAVRALQMAMASAPEPNFFAGWLGHALAVCGREAEAHALLERLQQSEHYILPSGPAFIHLGLQQYDAAFEWFDRAVDERDQMMMPILSYEHFDPIRDDPRFAALVRKMKLA